MPVTADMKANGTYEALRQAEIEAPVAELMNVSKTYGDVPAVADVNLRIAPGEFLSFLGPSGCGKTTALRMLAGFETPTVGSIRIDGQDVSGTHAHRRPVNMVFQSYALFPHLTVGGNIGYGLKQKRPRLSSATLDEKVARALDTVRLAGYGNRRIWELSGGQQQRVALARAIVNEPKLLLLDEPLAALDRKLRKAMQIELQDLQRQLGITFVLVTHDQEEALSLSDRVCVMRAGRIVQIGTPRQLYDRPRSQYVADFVGTSNFFDGRIESTSGDTASITLKNGKTYTAMTSDSVQPGETGCLSIRPEQIQMQREAGEDLIAGEILNRIFLGEHTEYLVKSAPLGTVSVLVPRQSDQGLGDLGKGDSVRLRWKPDAALVLRND